MENPGYYNKFTSTASFDCWDVKWEIYKATWGTYGSCVVIRQVDTGIGIALLKAGRGEYADNQTAPDLTNYFTENFRAILNKFAYRLGKADSTGTFRSVRVDDSKGSPGSCGLVDFCY